MSNWKGLSGLFETPGRPKGRHRKAQGVTLLALLATIAAIFAVSKKAKAEPVNSRLEPVEAGEASPEQSAETSDDSSEEPAPSGEQQEARKGLTVLSQKLKLVVEHHRRAVQRFAKFLAVFIAAGAALSNRVGPAYCQKYLVAPGLANPVVVTALSFFWSFFFSFLVVVVLGLGRSESLAEAKPDARRTANLTRLLDIAERREWLCTAAFVRFLQDIDRARPWVLPVTLFSLFQAMAWVNGQLAVAKLPLVSSNAVGVWGSLAIMVWGWFRLRKRAKERSDVKAPASVDLLLPLLSFGATIIMIVGGRFDFLGFIFALLGAVAGTGMTTYGMVNSHAGVGKKASLISMGLAFAVLGLPVFVFSGDMHWLNLKVQLWTAFNGATSVLAAFMYNWSNKELKEDARLVSSTNPAWSAVVGERVLTQHPGILTWIGVALSFVTSFAKGIHAHFDEAKKKRSAQEPAAR